MSIETSRLAVNDQTAEIITRIPVTTWVDGSPITDARCGGLYNKDSLGYFKLGFAGEFPISRLKNPTLVNIQKLIADVGAAGNITIVVDKIVDIISNLSIAVNCNIRIQSGGGFNVPNSSTIFTIGSPITLPPNQVFYGDGLVRLPYTQNCDPRWWGARVSTTTVYDSGAAFNKCAASAASSSSNMIIPPGTYDMEVTFDPPSTLNIIGGGWRKSILRGKFAGPVVDLADSNVLMHVGIEGNNIATTGVQMSGLVNRVGLDTIRIASCTEYGFYCEGLQNSLIKDLFIQYCGIANFYLGGNGPENCTFLNCNGNLEDSHIPDPSATFNIYILNSRNCRWIGGIFERGGVDYPVYIENSSGLSFLGGEIQSSGKACVYVARNNVSFDKTSFAFPTITQGGFAIETSSIAAAWTFDCRYTGTELRGNIGRFKGNVIVDYNRNVLLLNENYRMSQYGVWISYSGGNISYNTAKGCISFSTNGVDSGGYRSSNTADNIPLNAVLKLRFTIKNITGGNRLVKLFQGTSTSEVTLVGTFSEGTWELPVTNAVVNAKNIWHFRNGENSVAKTWELYDFFVEMVSGLPNTIEQLGIRPNYKQLTGSIIDLMYNVSGEIDLNANTTFTFTNPTNGVAQDYSIYNTGSQDVIIQFTNARVAVDSSLTIPPNQYAHMRISVHRSQPEVMVKLLAF